jgi:lon-related putative ATP-dependent protease
MTNPQDIRTRLAVSDSRLTTRIDPASLGFTTTQEVSSLEGTVGQDRALRALEFGLEVEGAGFNVYVAGNPGTGRNTTLAAYLRRLAASRPAPGDWVYVHNFSDPKRPRGIQLPQGAGRRLAQDMAALVQEAQARIPRAFESDDYHRRVEQAMSGVQERHRQLTQQMVEEARKRGIGLALTEAGVLAAPLGPDGEPLSPEALENLTPDQAHAFREQRHELQEYIAGRFAELRGLEREAIKTREQVNQESAGFAQEPLFAELRERYAEHAETLTYLGEVQADMLANVPLFLQGGQQPQAPGQMMLMEAGGGAQPDAESAFMRYGVNVFVDNAALQGAPVVMERNPSYYNVFGRMDHVFRMGVATTDFTQLHAGSLHRANGGYIVFQATDLLTAPFTWPSLKHALQARQIRMETLGEQVALVPTSSLEPEPVPLDVKIVLVGNPMLVRMLQIYDEDFPKLFKVKADFQPELELNQETIRSYARFIVNRVQEEGLPHFEASAVARVIEHSSRMVEDQKRLTARFADVADLITEAAFWSRRAGRDGVSGEDVEQAVAERRQRSNLVEERLQEFYDRGTLHVEVDGTEVGQINGLAVIDMGDYSFARPSRLTARVSAGRGEFGTVEQASQMSGRIHTKGFGILMGYLMGVFGADAVLPIRASIAFEQTYEEIDGDSASSTELYALLSALSGVPIRQGLAVTGSIDQLGRVQAIGGATRKVEGFFDVCDAKGLTGEQGVLIPATNVDNLVLSRQVTEAVESGRFAVYAVTRIEEGIELLTGVPAGEPDAEGNYPPETVFGKVAASLTAMTDRITGRERNNRLAQEKPPVKTEAERPEGREPDKREGPGAPPTPPPA